MKETRLVSLLKRIFHWIPKSKKRSFSVLIGGIFIVALFEAATLGAIALFASAIASPNSIIGSKPMEFLRSIINLELFSTTKGIILFLSLLVAVLVLCKNILVAWINFLKAKFSASVEAGIAQRELELFLYSSYSWHLRKKPADLVNVVSWRFHINNFFHGIMNTVNEGIIVLVMLTSLFLYQPVISAVIIGVIGTISVAVYVFIKKQIDRQAYIVREISRNCFVESSKAIQGIKDIKIFLKERAILKRFRMKNKGFSKRMAVQQTYASAPVLILETTGFLVISITIVIMLFFKRSDTAEIFSLISLLAVSAWRVLPAINRILSGISKIRVIVPFIEQILRYMEDAFKNCFFYEQDKNRLHFIDSIRFQNVSFKYEDRGHQALENITCILEKGKAIGVVGHSGAGKSTFVDILTGLLVPETGHIHIDGKKIDSSAEILRLRSSVGYVPQMPYIFDGSIVENISFSFDQDEVDWELLEECMNAASIDFIDELPKGYYTVLGERGVNLSGGQLQRIAIARALYRKPEILIFDEATNSLDHKTEKEVQKTMNSLKGDRTVIIIAHRLTSVEGCDYIIWLEKGRVVQIGPVSDVLYKYATAMQSG
jgi:ATP-binding cassette, subfamily B, bacterial PglK